MDIAEREGLKEQLLAMAAGRGDGIDLDSVNRWVIAGLKDPASFFQQLHILIPADSTLRAFASSLGGAYHREQNKNKRDPEQLQKILEAMGSSKNLPMNWPWWKKLLFFWKQ